MGNFVGIAVGLAVILALWPTLGILAAAWSLVSGELAALMVTAIISQRFLPLHWGYKRVLVLVSIPLLYLEASETGLALAGQIQTLVFLLIYCAIS